VSVDYIDLKIFKRSLHDRVLANWRTLPVGFIEKIKTEMMLNTHQLKLILPLREQKADRESNSERILKASGKVWNKHFKMKKGMLCLRFHRNLSKNFHRLSNRTVSHSFRPYTIGALFSIENLLTGIAASFGIHPGSSAIAQAMDEFR
jgi:hypothetical protein